MPHNDNLLPLSRERSVSGGELKLLAQDQSIGQRAGSGGDSQRTQELENSLAVAQEDLDKAQIEQMLS